MPSYRRPTATGSLVFFTVNLADRRQRLLTEHIGLLRTSVQAARADRPFGIEAWVVLPDHIHFIWRMPPQDRAYGVRIGAIKARFSMAMRRAGFTPPPPTGKSNGGVNPALRRKGEVGLWQPRFWEHHIRNEADFTAHLRYCWLNPVKHGYVTHPEDWPHSSVHWDKRFEAGMDMML